MLQGARRGYPIQPNPAAGWRSRATQQTSPRSRFSLPNILNYTRSFVQGLDRDCFDAGEGQIEDGEKKGAHAHGLPSCWGVVELFTEKIAERVLCIVSELSVKLPIEFRYAHIA